MSDRLSYRKDEWCVYAHVAADVVVYVGSGRRKRPFDLDGRSARHLALLPAVFDVVILGWFASPREAREFEAAELIRLRPPGNLAIPLTSEERKAKAAIQKQRWVDNNPEKARALWRRTHELHREQRNAARNERIRRLRATNPAWHEREKRYHQSRRDAGL